MNGTEELVGDEGVEKRLRSQAHWIYVESAIAALILTVLSFYFAVVLPEASRSSEGLTLEQAADFLIRHGYALLFGWVLLEQMGLPIPAAPLLIAAGALFWVVTVTSLGLMFSNQLEQIALRWGGWLVAVLAGGLAAYVLWKFIQRRRFLRRLRIARITPKELMDKLTAKENISIVDLRQPMDIEAFPQMIPGALRIAMEEIEERHGEIPRDRDVVLYCS